MKFFIALIILLSANPTLAETGSASDIKEPLLSMSKCLASYNWSSWNIWRFEVYAAPLEQVLIGNIDNYFRFSKSTTGFQHLVDGKIVAEYPDVTSIKQIAPSCTDNCPTNYQKRVSWFKRRCATFID